jgi:hypothetical protein
LTKVSKFERGRSRGQRSGPFEGMDVQTMPPLPSATPAERGGRGQAPADATGM